MEQHMHTTYLHGVGSTSYKPISNPQSKMELSTVLYLLATQLKFTLSKWVGSPFSVKLT
jgi:hypothetical protein